MEQRTSRAGLGSILFPILRILAVTYIAVLILAYFFQRRLLYFPSAEPAVIPALPRYHDLHEVDLTAADGVPLKAWHWPGRRPLTFLVFHGNAGHREHRLSWLERLRETGAGIFILDYRGYGGSGGSPSEDGLYRDAEAAAAWLEAKAISPVVYVGESLGAAVAVELALKRPPEAIILQSAFTSAGAVGQSAYPFLPVVLMIRDRFDTISKIGRISCPVMVIHGGMDSLIPLSMGRTLFEAVPGRKEWYEVAGADHNDPIWLLGADYVERISKFLGL
jgi:fermentation-respiration switch protein FrsA (DUF1100 family)